MILEFSTSTIPLINQDILVMLMWCPLIALIFYFSVKIISRVKW